MLYISRSMDTFAPLAARFAKPRAMRWFIVPQAAIGFGDRLGFGWRPQIDIASKASA